MSSSEDRRPSAWRGSPTHAIEESNLIAEIESGPSDRVLVLMKHEGNRTHVIRQLAPDCQVLLPTQAQLSPASFDLAVADISGLRDWWELLLDAKFQAEPTFLPVVLVLSRMDLKKSTRSFWDVVDEFVTTPIEPREFIERISMLLRTRRLALAQRNHLAYVVNHDRVTGLPNNNLFMNRVKDAIRDMAVLDSEAFVSVVHVPLSRILKSFGHHGMNTVASSVSTRLAALLGQEVSLARLTTEEWGIVHRPGAKLHEVAAELGRARTLGDEPFESSDEIVHLSPRIGVSVYPTDGADAPTLLDRAMSALALAQSSEPVFYSSDVQHAALRSIRTEARLHEALDEEQFELYFQPQVEISTGRVAGVEALIRWRLPSGRLVAPGQFMGVAEETGLICAIDRWVLKTSCRALRDWREHGLDPGRISVNVCVQDVRKDGFVSLVQEALKRNNIPPSCLELELTETDLMEAGGVNVEKLAELQAAGVRVALDDFGTGYSSLGYLRTLPISTVKIDRSFLTDLPGNDKDSAIVESIVGLANRFGFQTVAEGVETKEQLAYLANLNVDIAQGYLCGRPMSEGKMTAWLDKRHSDE